MAEKNLIDLISLILNSAEKCDSIPLLIRQLLKNIMHSVSCELITVRLGEEGDIKRYQAAFFRAGEFVFQNIGSENGPAVQVEDCDQGHSFPSLIPEDFWPIEACFWTEGRLQGQEGKGPISSNQAHKGWAEPVIEQIIVTPFTHNDGKTGLLVWGFSQANRPCMKDLDWYAHVAAFVGLTLKNWNALAELRERVKELSCLHGLTQLLGRSGCSVEEVLQGVVELLPRAWLYAGEASARIEYGGQEFISGQYIKGRQSQWASLMAGGKVVGRVEVSYGDEKPELDEGPFLAEERRLLENVARQVGQYIERRLYEAEKTEIMEKLHHADRLAMIGQVAATVAHEINEPLTSILGYAQLAANSEDLPPQISNDINKVVATSLQVREIIRKTLLYSRRIHPKTSSVNLNEAVRETLDLFEWRCHREGISTLFSSSEQRLDIIADPGRIRQVITNLVVNSIQAMPEGGELSLKTGLDKDWVYFSIVDTGQGMTAETVDKMFIPFFTTKEAGRGTGLGLSVVHDIVSEMDGGISVQSKVGSGTEVVVKFPRTAKGGLEAAQFEGEG